MTKGTTNAKHAVVPTATKSKGTKPRVRHAQVQPAVHQSAAAVRNRRVGTVRNVRVPGPVTHRPSAFAGRTATQAAYPGLAQPIHEPILMPTRVERNGKLEFVWFAAGIVLGFIVRG